MSCPNCDHTMHGISSDVSWCPRCGTIRDSQGDQAPELIERCREFENKFAPNVVNPDPLRREWVRSGIAESINLPDARPRT